MIQQGNIKIQRATAISRISSAVHEAVYSDDFDMTKSSLYELYQFDNSNEIHNMVVNQLKESFSARFEGIEQSNRKYSSERSEYNSLGHRIKTAFNDFVKDYVSVDEYKERSTQEIGLLQQRINQISNYYPELGGSPIKEKPFDLSSLNPVVINYINSKQACLYCKDKGSNFCTNFCPARDYKI